MNPITLTPDWRLPDGVFAYTTTRNGGGSQGSFGELNLGAHVGDVPLVVARNRELIPYSDKLVWLNQVHSDVCVTLPVADSDADAAISTDKRWACTVMTADCIPILLCDCKGREVAAVHAGWKGLELNIINKTLLKMSTPSQNVMAWIGPGICAAHYEVSDALAARFSHYRDCVTINAQTGRYHLNLPGIAKAQLINAGINAVVDSSRCTYCEHHLFYSHRRATHEGHAQTGRMASVIGFRS